MLHATQFLSVFLTGMIELWAAVPLGLALKIDPLWVVLLSAAGSSAAALLVLAVGEPFRRWLMGLRKSSSQGPGGRMQGIMERYGVPGLCLLSPLLVGSHIGAALALGLGGKKWAIALWMSVGCLLWSAAFTALGAAGVSFLVEP